jgi:hypothetical protein
MWTNISLSRLLKPDRLYGIIYFYKIQTGCMQKWFILLLAGALVCSCKNNNQKEKEKKEKTGDTTATTHYNDNDRDTVNATGYTWKVADQKKFLEDCKGNMEKKADSVEVKVFCSCMLAQSQKYYSGYKQMEENSNEDFDSKISIECLAKYPGGQDDQ